MPNARVSGPLPFGMCTRRTGGAPWPAPAATPDSHPGSLHIRRPFVRQHPSRHPCACAERPHAAIPGRCDGPAWSTPSAVAAAPVPLSVAVSLRRCWSPTSPPPSSNGSMIRSLLSSSGSGRGPFPGVHSTTRHSDSRPSFPSHFVLLRLTVPRLRRSFVSPTEQRRFLRGPGVLSRRWPRSGSFGVETTGSPRFLGGPACACPALGPRRDRRARPLRRVGAAFRSDNSVGSRGDCPIEALSHGPPTRCLRFAVRLTPRPRKTRFRLLASFAGRVWLPAGSLKRFVLLTRPPFPGFAWRNISYQPECAAGRNGP